MSSPRPPQKRPGQNRPPRRRPAGRGPARTGASGRSGGPRGGSRLLRVVKALLVAVLAAVLLGVVGVAYAYNRTSIPDPNELVDAQTTTVYYNDGTTVLGRFADQDRTIVDGADIPQHVRDAFVAAEDRSFYENPGISPSGIARAAWGIVTRQPAGGGSTITQQYVKNYFLTSDQTLQRKATEILLALKVEDRLTKDEILTDYLNTIYFGRSAWGIQAASQRYFGTGVQSLTIEQAALLAGVLPAPNRYDPAVDPAAAQERWDYVVDGLVETGALTRAEADALTMPETVESSRPDTYAGSRGYLLEAARTELVNRVGLTETEIDTGGLEVVTTFDPRIQQAADDAVRGALPSPEELDGEQLPEGLRVGAVTLDPSTGAVLAMYAGEDLTRTQNSVTRDIAQAGSTFKPFTLVAALEQGVPLFERYRGRDDLEVEGYDRPVSNFNDTDYGRITLPTATANSVNTVYAALNADIGPENTRDVAVRAGLPPDTNGLNDFVSNVLGPASPRIIDMAQAYATFAAQGEKHRWHTVAEVRDPAGAVVYSADPRGEQVFDADVMADATYAMQQVVERGSGSTAQELDRPVAGKTGTSTNNHSAWFIGYTPQLVTAVGLYQVGEDGSSLPLDIPGYRQVTGGSLPARIWTDLMDEALEGAPVLEFPERSSTERTSSPRTTTRAPAPDPTPERTEEPSRTPEPSTEPEPSEEPDADEPDADDDSDGNDDSDGDDGSGSNGEPEATVGAGPSPTAPQAAPPAVPDEGAPGSGPPEPADTL